MLNASRVVARWRRGLSVGVGLHLLLGSSPAAAAGIAGIGVSGLTTGIGLMTALWTVVGVRRAPAGAAGIAALAFALALACSAFWFWRRQQARAAFSARRRSAGSVVPRCAGFAVPAGLDCEQVLTAARGRFMRLQAAWDAADVSALRSLTTPEMLDELLDVLTARESRTSRTDVISLHAELLGLEELGAAYLASIEFSGLIRESAEQGEVPFRELWMLAGTKDDAAPTWRLARQQALL
ncbi:MAG: Tim44-like domain-containing protein [Caldimonas sp.]